MTRERLFRQDDEVGALDWRQAARELDVDLETARLLYDYAMRVALGSAQRATPLYLNALRTAATARMPPEPVPGRMTRQAYESLPGKYWTPEQLAAAGPGKWTLAEIESTRRESQLPGYGEVQKAMASLMGTAPAAGEVPAEPRMPEAAPAAARTGEATPASTRHPFGRDAGGRRPAVPRQPMALPSGPGTPVREQLQAAAAAGRGVAEVLAAADPAAAREALHQLRVEDTPALRRVTEIAAGEVDRVLARGSSSDALPAEHATRLSPHVGPAAAGAARLHTDDAADLVAAAHHARAVTIGSDIYFARGEFAPGTAPGDELLAHELTHVAQGQRGELTRAAAKGIDSGGTLDPAEAEADLRARHAVTQLHTDAAGPRPAQPAREPAANADKRDPAHGSRGEAQQAGATALPAGVPGRDGPQPHHEAARQNPAPARALEPAGSAGAAAGPRSAPHADLGQRAGGAGADEPGRLLSRFESAPASSLATTLTTVQASTPQAFKSERARAQEEMPRIPAPTGLPARGAGGARREPAATASTTAREPTALHPAPAAGPQRTPENLVHEAPAPRPVAPTQLAGSDGAAHGSEPSPGHEDPALARSAQSALASVRLGADQVSTTAIEVPTVDMRGETDPAQLDTAHATAQRDTDAAAAEARQATAQDRGENDIFPAATPEVLEAKLAENKGAAAEGKGGAAGPVALETLPAEARASIDAEASPVLHAKIGEQHERYAAGKTEQDAAKREAHARTRADMTQAEADARARQTEAQVAARGEVTTARADWQHDIDHIDQDFRAQATTARDQHRHSISNEQQNANRRAAEHIQSAEQQAEAEKRKAEAEANKKKDEGKKESGGFLGWVKSKAKALIDGIKAAVNFIYDNLRKAVKAIFEACKKLALAVIELARKAIVGLIKAYGEILKGLVKVALAAFPQLRDRILRRIDQAVQKATQLVNTIADGLKKAVSALIDFLASTIDKILGLVQDLYNAALTVIGMLVSGELQELLQKIGQLIAAAKTAPGQFETAAYEQLLGGDLDEPLSPGELIAAGRTPPGQAAGPGGADPMGGGEEHEGEVPHPPWTEENVGVENVASGVQLSPELEQELAARAGENGTIEFGNSDGADRNMESILGIQPGQTPGQQGEGQQAQQGALAADGLTPRERAAVKWTLMKQGLAKWWSDNWPYVIGGGVLAVAGFIVANILTGGAILAALPTIMTVVGYLFTGVLVVQLAGYLRDFLQKGWAGDIRGGGKALASALAAGAIELISWLTFKAGSAALKGAKAAAKGVVKGAQAVARTGARAARGALNLVKRGANYLIKGSKVLLRGAGDAIGRAVKSLRELGEKLLAKTKFKGFRFRIEGKRWELEGRINPWVLLATGKVEYVTERGGKLGGRTTVPGASGAQDAIVIGRKGDVALKELFEGMSQADAQAAYKLLSRTDLRPDEILNALKSMDPKAAEKVLQDLRQFKDVDEAELRKVIEDYRKQTEIPKGKDADGKITGGTVAAGKTEVPTHNIDSTHSGASAEAQRAPKNFDDTFQSPQADARAQNHAEQTVLGKSAKEIEEAIEQRLRATLGNEAENVEAFAAAKNLAEEQVQGTLKIAVDQAVCSACRQGLDSSVSAGIIKQFSDRFKSMTLYLIADGTSEILIVQGGKILR